MKTELQHMTASLHMKDIKGFDVSISETEQAFLYDEDMLPVFHIRLQDTRSRQLPLTIEAIDAGDDLAFVYIEIKRHSLAVFHPIWGYLLIATADTMSQLEDPDFPLFSE